MAQCCITGKRIVKFQIPNTYDINKIQLGIPVMNNEAKIVENYLNTITNSVHSSSHLACVTGFNHCLCILLPTITAYQAIHKQYTSNTLEC